MHLLDCEAKKLARFLAHLASLLRPGGDPQQDQQYFGQVTGCGSLAIYLQWMSSLTAIKARRPCLL